MAEEHVGQRQERYGLWLKIFTAFKLALEAKKLALAAVGILVTAIVWLMLAWLFYAPRKMPVWKDFDLPATTETEKDEIYQKRFKPALDHWNLMHELAGSRFETTEWQPADVASSLDQYNELNSIYEKNRRYYFPVVIRESTSKGALELFLPREGPAGMTVKIKPMNEDDLAKLKGKTIAVHDLYFEGGKDDNVVRLDPMNVMATVEQNFKELLALRTGAKSLKEIQLDIARYESPDKRKTANEALQLYLKRFTARDATGEPIPVAQPKPAGRLAVLPWFEERGPNPYLMVADTIKQAGGTAELAKQPWHLAEFLRWFFVEEMPVLLEPLYKFLTPVIYLFDRRAGAWEYLYLCLVILSTLAIWGFFGGAITRIAAVQFARGERVTLRDAIGFARDRFLSFFAAPVFPLFFLLILTVALIVYGYFEMIPIFGDIFIAGLLWPIVLLVGFIMAVVLVGLVGWPLMYATISTEASDSFDALSRSYSYVYQAPWHYLWYSFVAVVYGAALVFFVTFMTSLLVYLGKWGVDKTPGIYAADREPAYLFMYAPTSFGWRDLLIHDSPAVEAKPGFDTAGLSVVHYQFTDKYQQSITWYNKTGAALVWVWITLLFLLMIGFSYSYFWSAATIIYFLMRRQVDDTDLDEVHLEGEGVEEPFTKPATPPPAAKPGAVSLTMVESPSLRTAVTPAEPEHGARTPVTVAAPVPVPVSVPVPPPQVVAPPVPEPAPAAQEEPASTPENGEGAKN